MDWKIWTLIGMIAFLIGPGPGLIWGLLECVCPFQYRNVLFAELRDHFNHLLRRGWTRSQMVVVDEATGKTIRLRKSFKYGGDTNLRLIVLGVTRHDRNADEIVRRLADSGLDWTFGSSVPRRYRDKLTCNCNMNLDVVMQAVESALFDLYELPRDSTFRLFVRGKVSWWDELVTGESLKRERLGKTLGTILKAEHQHAKPYKWWQSRKGGVSHLLGRGVGTALRVLFGGSPKKREDDS